MVFTGHRLLSAVFLAFTLTVAVKGTFAAELRVLLSDAAVLKHAVYVFNEAKNNETLKLRGNIVSYLGSGRYIFEDATGRVTLYLHEDKDWSYISKDEPVELIGKVKRNFLKTEFIVNEAEPVAGIKNQSRGMPRNRK